MLRSAFPNAEIHADNRYPGGQNDFTVRIDDFVIAIEAKSSRVVQAARRGGAESLQRALKQIVLEGSAQAYRLISFLQAAQEEGHPAMLSDGRTINVDGVTQYIPCVVHLEPLGRVGADTKPIARILQPKNLTYVPAMSIALADLETVFALLDTEAERVHYLYRRRQLERFFSYSADEFDLLATYFDNQLNFDERFTGGELMLYGRSAPVDRWLSREQELGPVARPRRRMTQRFKAAIERVAHRKHAGWMRLAVVLQDVFDEDQRDLERQLRRAAKSIQRGGFTAEGLIEQTLTEGRLAFAYVAYALLPRDEARDLVTASLTRLIDSDRFSEVLVLGIDLAAVSAPYHLVAVGAKPWGPGQSVDKGIVLG